MPNNEMDYSLIHRTPDGNGKILVTTPGSPDKGSWETEAELKTYVNQDVVKKTDIVQSLGQQVDKVPSNKAVDDAINTLNTRVTNIEETLMGENEITVQYPDDGNYSSLMPNKVPTRALKFAEVPRFRGKSRAWNQLVPVPTSATETANNVTFTNNTDGTITITTNGTATANTAYICYIGSWRDGLSFVGGHKYLFSGSGLSSVRVEYIASPVGSGSNTVFYIDNFSDSSIATATGNGSWLYLEIRVSNGSTVNTTIIPQIYDLTAIFGAGNEPSTVADALAQIPALGQYNAYDAGSLVDTVVSGVKAVGVNIWEEEWENGTINLSTGADVPSSSYVRSKGYIEVTPLSMLYFCMAVGQRADGMYVCYYDDNKNFIRPVLANSANALVYQMPFNCRYIRFYMAGGYGSTYNHDIQICLNSYADKTTYHPYKTDTLSLSTPVTLRSAGSVSDELDVESGVVTHKIYKKTFSASDGWELSGAGNFFLEISDMYQVDYTTQISLLAEYAYDNTNSSIDKTYWNNGRFIFVRDTSFNGDTSAFASALAGKKLNYALATPTTESIDPVPYNFVEVEGGGTVDTIQTQTPIIDNSLDVTYDIIPQ